MEKVAIGLMLTAGLASSFKSTIGGANQKITQIGDALKAVKMQKSAFSALETAEDQLKNSLKLLKENKQAIDQLKNSQKKYDQEVSKNQKELNTRNLQLKKTLKAITSVKAALEEEPDNKALIKKLTELTKKKQLLKKTIDSTTKSYKSAEKESRRFGREIASLERKEKTLSKSVQTKEKAVKTATRTIQDAGYSIKNYRQQIGKLNPQIDTLTKKQIKLGQAIKSQRVAQEKANAARMKMVDAYFVGKGMAGVLSGVGQRQSMMADIAITADLNDQQIAEAKKTISQAAADAFQQNQSVNLGLNALITAGMDFDVAKDMLASVAKTSTAAGAEVEEVSKTVFALNSNLGVTQNEMLKAMDMLVIGGKEGAFELKNMAQYFPMLTADAQKLGLQGTKGVATLGAALQIAKRGAGDPAEAANNMKNYMAKLTAPETIKKFSKTFSVDLEAEMKKAMEKGLDPIEHSLELIQKHTDGDAFRIGEVFGDMQAKSFITPMLKDWEDYKKIKAEMQKADGAVEKDLARRAELDPTKQWTRLGESLKSLRDTALVPLIKPTTELIVKLTEFIKPIEGIIQTNPEMVKWAGILIGSLVAGKVAGSALGFAFHFLKGSVMGTFKVFGGGATAISGGIGLFKKLSKVAISLGRVALPIVLTAVRAIGLALVANPIGALVTVLATGAGLIIANWDTIGPKIKASLGMAFEGIKAQFGTLIQNLKDKPLQTLMTWPVTFAKMGFEVINGFAKGLFDFDLKAKITGIGDSIKGWFKEKLGIHSPSIIFKGFGDDVMQGFINGLKAKLKSVKAAISNIGESVTSWFKNKLGIHSPSRVFMGLGGHVNEGLAIGLEKTANRPVGKVLDITKKLTAAAAISTSASMPLAAQTLDFANSASKTNKTSQAQQAQTIDASMQVTINVTAQPGMDPHAIGLEVKRQLENIQRQQQTRYHSALYDGDEL